MSDLLPMTANQRRMLVDTRQLWDAWQAAWRRRAGYAGSLSWKEEKGSDYLVKVFDDPGTRVRKMRSLGPRSPETERIYQEFRTGKEEAKERLDSLSRRLSEQARLNRAVDLGRVPTIASKILRRLDREGLLGHNVYIAGTNAIYAYEAAAGVFVRTDLLATGDLDILMEARARLRLTVTGEEPASVIDVLRSVDRSFKKADEASFRAVNRDGYYVDLIKAAANPPWRDEREGFGEGDLLASSIANMKWVANAPKFEATAVGEDGQPVPMACPDPRAFALYKLWLGTKDDGRDPVKRARDVEQAHTVAAIVTQHLPQLPFEPEHLKCFPKPVVDFASEGDDPFFKPF